MDSRDFRCLDLLTPEDLFSIVQQLQEMLSGCECPTCYEIVNYVLDFAADEKEDINENEGAV